MKKTLIFILCVSVVLSGCLLPANSSKRAAQARASAVVAVTLPDFQLQAGDSVSWYGDIVWADPQQLLSERTAVRGQLKEAIQKKQDEEPKQEACVR